MNPKEFDYVLTTLLDRCVNTMKVKEEDYATDADRLANFNEVADFMGSQPIEITPDVVAFIYLMKHIQSIKNIVVSKDFTDWHWQLKSGREGKPQRIADAINYLILITACIEDHRNDESACSSQKEGSETPAD